MQAASVGQKIPIVEIPHATQGIVSGPAIGACERLAACDAIDQVVRLQLNHLVQRSAAEFEKELAVSRLMLTSPDSFLQFPCSSILDPAHANDAFEKKLTIFKSDSYTRSEKAAVIAKLNAQIGSRFNASLFSEVALIADEMISNAHEHGPMRLAGESTATGATQLRATPSAMRSSQFRVAMDDERVVVACIDPYGNLNIQDALSRLQRAFRLGIAATLNLKEGVGAGVGLFNIFRCSSAIYLATIPGQRTVVSAALPLRGNSQSREEASKNIHLLVRGHL